GFGGGGAGIDSSVLRTGGGIGGFGGGDGADYEGETFLGARARGGGGAGLGGAIFNRGGNVTVMNSTLTENAAHGGDGATYIPSVRAPSGAGSAFGGAIFNLNGTVHLTNNTLAANKLHRASRKGGSGRGGSTEGYQVYNLADSLDGNTATATLTLANTILARAPGHGHDLVNQLVTNAANNQAIVANPSSNRPVPKNNIITTAIANFDGNFVDGSGGSRGVVLGVY